MTWEYTDNDRYRMRYLVRDDGGVVFHFIFNEEQLGYYYSQSDIYDEGNNVVRVDRYKDMLFKSLAETEVFKYKKDGSYFKKTISYYLGTSKIEYCDENDRILKEIWFSDMNFNKISFVESHKYNSDGSYEEISMCSIKSYPWVKIKKYSKFGNEVKCFLDGIDVSPAKYRLFIVK